MATDPNDICLNQEDKQLLAQLVDKSGKLLTDALREAITSYLGAYTTSAEPNGAPNVQEDCELAFLRAAGTWADMDTDALLKDLYAQRLHVTRPEPQL